MQTGPRRLQHGLSPAALSENGITVHRRREVHVPTRATDTLHDVICINDGGGRNVNSSRRGFHVSDPELREKEIGLNRRSVSVTIQIRQAELVPSMRASSLDTSARARARAICSLPLVRMTDSATNLRGSFNENVLFTRSLGIMRYFGYFRVESRRRGDAVVR